MKTPFLSRYILISALVLMSISAFSQTLPTPAYSVIPSCLYPGAMETLAVIPVPGATGYLFETDSAGVNTVLFDGQLSPIVKSTPSVDLTGVMSSVGYPISITAFSACCTSATNTAVIPGAGAQIEFSSANTIFASPSSNHLFTVQQTCPCPVPATYNWEATGDITFSNGTQSMISSVQSVTLFFGSSFGSGTLCVKTVNNFGMQSSEICTGIFHPGYTPD